MGWDRATGLCLTAISRSGYSGPNEEDPREGDAAGEAGARQDP